MPQPMRWTIAVALLASGVAATAAQDPPVRSHRPPTPSETLPQALEVQKRRDIRVVYEAKDDVWDAGIGKALYYVRGLLEAYKDMGVAPENLRVSIVLHGPTAYWLLKEEPYQKFKQDEFAFNPNDKVVQELLEHGVSVEICQVTMKNNGWKAEDLLPGVTRVHDGYTRIIDLQQQGYAYIRF